MESVEYNHSKNRHTETGAYLAFAAFTNFYKPLSVLDVGCGIGTWLRAAIDLEIEDIQGVDGAVLESESLLFPYSCFKRLDLRQPWELGRRFDLVLCLEVAEHLKEIDSGVLLDTLVRHSDRVIFSAACPGQPGQHHVNCQWPSYWQTLFNDRGYVCNDDLRWLIWDIPEVEPWYKQNVFCARRSSEAGREQRIRAVIHPEMVQLFCDNTFSTHADAIILGRMPVSWYLKMPFRVLKGKLGRHLFNRQKSVDLQ